MKTPRTTNTKQIRQDLVGFLRSLGDGQPVTILYRSRPLVTVTAEPASPTFQTADAGTPAAIKRSIELIRHLPPRSTHLDPRKNFKELYGETRTL